ncbi:tetratricopeptide repeat protein, partial [candidate division WOR-3 bacterium]|nr:tetratricopeptide repeat protein [candidate division WOR-3 bacterium]
MNGLDFSDISKLNEKYAREPKSRIFVQLADAYRKNKMIDEALDVLNKGIEYHPQYALAYLVIGKCYYDTRAHVQAKDAFEKTIALDPQNVVALRMLAKTYEMLKDDKGQINAYKSIIAIDPLDTQAKEKLSMLEALQRKEPLYTVAMAEEYEKQGNIEESLKIYENLLYTDPSDLILRQKTVELKKAVEDKRKKTDEEKILDLQLQRMFQPEELKDKKPTTSADKPAKDADRPAKDADRPAKDADRPAK